MKNNLKREVLNYIINWNRLYPIDYWWRKKHKIPFGSVKHRQANFIQMYYEYEEEKMINDVIKKSKEEHKDEDFIKELNKSGVTKNMTQEQIDYDFENIDLSSYNTVKESNKKDG